MRQIATHLRLMTENTQQQTEEDQHNSIIRRETNLSSQNSAERQKDVNQIISKPPHNAKVKRPTIRKTMVALAANMKNKKK